AQNEGGTVKRIQVVLLALCAVIPLMRTGHAQTSKTDGKDAIQWNYDRLLKGLSSIQVVRVKSPEGTCFGATGGAISEDALVLQVDSVLKRYHLPLQPIAATPQDGYYPKENVGSLVLSASCTSTTIGKEVTYKSFTLRLTLYEPAVLKRDLSRQ